MAGMNNILIIKAALQVEKPQQKKLWTWEHNIWMELKKESF
jgi:hypothetical protein